MPARPPWLLPAVLVAAGFAAGTWATRPDRPPKPAAVAPDDPPPFADWLKSVPRANLPALLRDKRRLVQKLEAEIAGLEQQITAYSKPTEYRPSLTEVTDRGRMAVALTRQKVDRASFRDKLVGEIDQIERELNADTGGGP
jgi:hypothetical protein